MNSIATVHAPARASGKRIAPSAVVNKLVDSLCPRDHAGKGNWDSNADIPLAAWLGAVVFVAGWVFFLWLGRGAGF